MLIKRKENASGKSAALKTLKSDTGRKRLLPAVTAHEKSGQSLTDRSPPYGTASALELVRLTLTE
jgi:hypothetical protein